MQIRIMDKSFGRNCTNNDLLSQSYIEGIQKFAGNKQNIPEDFQIPASIIEEREKAWSSLFTKYTSNISDVEIDLITLEPKLFQEEVDLVTARPEVPEYDISDIQKQMPMRKSMSVVQHWVETGNMPYMEHCNDETHSDTGSSLEEEFLESDYISNCPCPRVNLSYEKYSEVNETFCNKHLHLTGSSNSSIDTAAYILANNNTTKKADTLVIVEGSKHDKEAINSTITAKENSNNKNENEKNCTPLSPSKIYNNIDTILQCVDAVKNRTITDKVKQNIKSFHLDISSNSDESVSNNKNESYLNIHGVQSQSSSVCNTIQNRQSKLCKRKLYNNTDSPVDLTPASETSSVKTQKRSIGKCEHPGLYTPTYWRPSYLAKHKKFNRNKKRKSRLSSSILLKSRQIIANKSSNDLKDEKEDINGCHKKLCKSINQTHNKLNLKNYDCNGTKIEIKDSVDKKETSIKRSKFKLRPLTVRLCRLPYIYEKLESPINLNIHHKIFDAKKRNKKSTKNSSKITNVFLKDEDFLNSVNKLFENSYDNEKYFKTFIERDFDENIKCYSSNINNFIISNKLANNASDHISKEDVTDKTNYKSTINKPEEKKCENLLKKYSKFTIVISSSDDESGEKNTSNKIKNRSSKRKCNTKKKLENNEHTLSILHSNFSREDTSIQSSNLDKFLETKQDEKKDKTFPSEQQDSNEEYFKIKNLKNSSNTQSVNKTKLTNKKVLTTSKHKNEKYPLSVTSFENELLPVTKTVQYYQREKNSIEKSNLNKNDDNTVFRKRKTILQPIDSFDEEPGLQLVESMSLENKKSEADNSSKLFNEKTKIEESTDILSVNNDLQKNVKEFQNSTKNKIEKSTTNNYLVNILNSDHKSCNSIFQKSKDSLSFSNDLDENFLDTKKKKFDQNKSTVNRVLNENSFSKRLHENVALDEKKSKKNAKGTKNKNNLVSIKRKNTVILESSDEECIVPLKIK